MDVYSEEFSREAAKSPPSPPGEEGKAARAAGKVTSVAHARREAAELHRRVAERQLVAAAAAAADGSGVAVPEAYMFQAIAETVAHEVGHTLGLRHNFKGSTALTYEQLREPARQALTGSVMDYNAAFIPSNRSHQGLNYYSTRIGAYDEWAIAYGYMDVSGEQPGVQPSALSSLAALGSARPELAFGTDEDTDDVSADVDPMVNLWDLGADPLAFHEDRLALAQVLLEHSEERNVLNGEAWTKQVCQPARDQPTRTLRTQLTWLPAPALWTARARPLAPARCALRRYRRGKVRGRLHLFARAQGRRRPEQLDYGAAPSVARQHPGASPCHQPRSQGGIPILLAACRQGCRPNARPLTRRSELRAERGRLLLRDGATRRPQLCLAYPEARLG